MVNLPLGTLLWALPLVSGALHPQADKINFGGPPRILHWHLGFAENGAAIAEVARQDMNKLYNHYAEIRKTAFNLHPTAHKVYHAECYFELCINHSMLLLTASRNLSHHIKGSLNPGGDRIDVVKVDTFDPRSQHGQFEKFDCPNIDQRVRARYYVDKIRGPHDKSGAITFYLPNSADYFHKGSCVYTALAT